MPTPPTSFPACRGIKQSNPEFALPQIPNFQMPYRTLQGDDVAATMLDSLSQPIAQLDLRNSRYGTGNIIQVEVSGPATGVVAALYRQSVMNAANVWILDQTAPATTAAAQTIKFFDLLAGLYTIVFTSTGASSGSKLFVNAGGTV